MSNARVERMVRELKADSPRTLLDWFLGPEPKVEQPVPSLALAAAADAQPVAAPIALKKAA